MLVLSRNEQNDKRVTRGGVCGVHLRREVKEGPSGEWSLSSDLKAEEEEKEGDGVGGRGEEEEKKAAWEGARGGQ